MNETKTDDVPNRKKDEITNFRLNRFYNSKMLNEFFNNFWLYDYTWIPIF